MNTPESQAAVTETKHTPDQKPLATLAGLNVMHLFNMHGKTWVVSVKPLEISAEKVDLYTISYWDYGLRTAASFSVHSDWKPDVFAIGVAPDSGTPAKPITHNKLCIFPDQDKAIVAVFDFVDRTLVWASKEGPGVGITGVRVTNVIPQPELKSLDGIAIGGGCHSYIGIPLNSCHQLNLFFAEHYSPRVTLNPSVGLTVCGWDVVNYNDNYAHQKLSDVVTGSYSPGENGRLQPDYTATQPVMSTPDTWD